MNEQETLWKLCPICKGLYLQRHQCPPQVLAKIDAQIDAIMDEELSTWKSDVKKFWKSTDVQFWNYLLEEDKW